jgi:predicted transcriptional regulator
MEAVMPTTQTTIRLDPVLKGNLEQLSKLRSMTLNKLVTLALEQFVASDARALRQELRQSLEVLEKISAQDPRFETAIAEAAAAEAAMVEDPVEGTPYLTEDRPATRAVRDILSA